MPLIISVSFSFNTYVNLPKIEYTTQIEKIEEDKDTSRIEFTTERNYKSDFGLDQN
jgi:hypothetical protein